MELKNWLAVVSVVALVDIATPIFLVSSSATTAAAATAGTLGLTISNPALAAVGGAAVLLAVAGVATSAVFRGRGKRAAVERVNDDGISSNAIDILFAAAGSLDHQTNCGLRLVCELAATPVDQLADDEALIMSLFGRESILNHDHINSPITPFQLAVFLGQQSGSATTCANTYRRCPYTSRQVMDILGYNGAGQT
ncbi:uncharacterized protein [Panulirus ornatus]|uniref:uncharacterized protein n=1 Tax=Panulirus ornatus TaxID=150431 RepID=UPI003A8802F1